MKKKTQESRFTDVFIALTYKSIVSYLFLVTPTSPHRYRDIGVSIITAGNVCGDKAPCREADSSGRTGLVVNGILLTCPAEEIEDKIAARFVPSQGALGNEEGACPFCTVGKEIVRKSCSITSSSRDLISLKKYIDL